MSLGKENDIKIRLCQTSRVVMKHARKHGGGKGGKDGKMTLKIKPREGFGIVVWRMLDDWLVQELGSRRQDRVGVRRVLWPMTLCILSEV